ncbi:MAG: NAD-dependent epimerase/dehydratase family protein [Streptococcaceae bacterium]|jgi:UDP-glucose 4-epimerase|nr:NAD-dependent epimerase/dehydratase family protein [Streptococcaceae bacterium]
MKKVLITGKNSYIGTSLERWLERYLGEFEVDTLDMRNPEWKEHDFSAYDSVFHVAGLAHSDTGKASEETKRLYYRVNTDLTIETAQKAKDDGVKQFIFMSSIIVYGESGRIGEKKVITRETKPNPANFYGDSKLQAEIGIEKLASDDFKVAILRPPMIYGKGSKGNYPKLAKLAKVLPVFPDIENERSVLHIDNLTEFLKHIIVENDGGYFYPQNSEYVKTSDFVRVISEIHGKKTLLTKLGNPLIRLVSKRVGLVNKVFGNLSYDLGMSEYSKSYDIRGFEKSVELTEN